MRRINLLLSIFAILAATSLTLACKDEQSSTVGKVFDLEEVRAVAEQALAKAETHDRELTELRSEVNTARDSVLRATRDAEEALVDARDALDVAESAMGRADDAHAKIAEILKRLDAIEAQLAGDLAEAAPQVGSEDQWDVLLIKLRNADELELSRSELRYAKERFRSDQGIFLQHGIEEAFLDAVAKERAAEAETTIGSIKRHLEVFYQEQGRDCVSVDELFEANYISDGGYSGQFYRQGYTWEGEVKNGRFVGVMTGNPRTSGSPVVKLDYAADGTASIRREDVDRALLRQEILDDE